MDYPIIEPLIEDKPLTAKQRLAKLKQLLSDEKLGANDPRYVEDLKFSISMFVEE